MSLKDIYNQKIYPNLYFIEQRIERVPYHIYAGKHADDTENFNKDSIKIMQIKEGEYEYEYFNFCYLHNMLSLIIYARYHKMYPQICVNADNKENIQWEWYFESLNEEVSSKRDVTFAECKKKTNAYLPKFDDIFAQKEVHIWCQWYKKYIRLNSKTQKYVEEEYKQLFEGKNKVLGVICRGTDYLALKPSGHPVQPEIQNVIAYCKKYMEKDAYDAIYLATEERKTRDIFERAFPGKILENRRQYYDDIYDKDTSISYIKYVNF